ncbi:hypothetical protein IP84_02165 [beta proteobacterium AAP99]|nr:hypothetical protein IP84_02165 [beta proteobacterium AAP99]
MLNRIAKGQCDQAVEQLNGMLEKPTAATYLIAGSMYERGACLKPNTDRARDFYAKAWGLGDTARAPAYLAALSASAAGGADVAQTLWWYARLPDGGRAPMPEICRVAKTEDVEAFVRGIESWSADRRERCRLAVGLEAMASAIKPFYPFASLLAGGQGQFDVRVDFARGTVEVMERSGFRSTPLKDLLEKLYRDAVGRLGPPKVQPTAEWVVVTPWEFKIQ